MKLKVLCVIVVVATGAFARQQSVPVKTESAPVKTVEVTPRVAEVEVGQQLKLTAVGKDESGKTIDVTPAVWFAAPFDVAAADNSGNISFFNPGEAQIGAVVAGKVGTVRIRVKPAPVTTIDLPSKNQVVVGGAMRPNAIARTAMGNPRADVAISWSTDNPSTASVDAAGLVIGLKPGKANITAICERGSAKMAVEVTANPVKALRVEPSSANARTGDVVRFSISAADAAGKAINSCEVRWAVSGESAMVEPDGAFVAERPGAYVVSASVGDRQALASVIVTPRNAERELEVVGRAPLKEFQTAEQWIIGNFAYVSTISDKLMIYDVSDPAHPKLTDTVKVDARHTNDISTTADGKIAVLTREGASSRKNGIVFLDTSDPAHPKVISDYTATVTGGVHSAFVDSHYVYLTDDATGSMRVIDFQDVKNPREVARWQVESELVRKIRGADGEESTAGRYLHDVQVKDGLAYLAYWRDGLVILDVGNGIKGGSPEKPQLVSQLRMNYHELYGDGWLAGAHAVFRYKNYVFVGDEVFPAVFDIQAKNRIPVRGIVHVVEVSDINHPREVADYSVPEGGAHNVWVKDDVLSMGYYSGGARVVDVSGELRGDLYRQGREIGRLWTGDPDGFRSNLPFTWGAQPHGDLIYFNDINSGIWIVKIGKPRQKGSTTAPGY
ncbi:MAG TPA: Ig-like domain-containing protein [Blastocatellia bacterium]|nr:Ig-like domain-containing protein [Blastocatellia bacterium]